MGFSYDPKKTQTEALHWVRMKVGDKRSDRVLLQDEELTALLVKEGITATTDPLANPEEVTEAAARACEAIAAGLGSQSEIVMSDVGPIKRTAADWYLKFAKLLRKEVQTVGTISFTNPGAYDITHVTGVDDLPDLE